MNKLIAVGLLAGSASVHAQEFYIVPEAGTTGTVSAYCYYMSQVDCDAWIYNKFNRDTSTYSVPPPVDDPVPPPPPPQTTLTTSNLQVRGTQEAGSVACFLYNYTVPNGESSGTETRKVHTANWGSEYSAAYEWINLLHSQNERCAQFDIPSTEGSYIGQVCLTVQGATKCTSTDFTVSYTASNPPVADSGNDGEVYCPPESDTNGNGWGWDGEKGCQVTTSNNSNDSTIGTSGTDDDYCPPESDTNGNGWGWDGEKGCQVNQTSSEPENEGELYCPPESDTNGNGWGWDGEKGCQV